MKVCPQCAHPYDGEGSCSICGYVRGRYVRYEAERTEIPTEVVVLPGGKGEEVKFQDRYHIHRMRRVSALKEKDAKRFRVVMALLEKEGGGLAFSLSEIRDAVRNELGEVETKGLKKLVEKMVEVGAVNAGWSQMQQMRYYSKP